MFPPFRNTKNIPAISQHKYSRQIEESISIADIFPPIRGVDFYCRYLPAKSSREINSSRNQNSVRSALFPLPNIMPVNVNLDLYEY
jgi:hypothetical protein